MLDVIIDEPVSIETLVVTIDGEVMDRLEQAPWSFVVPLETELGETTLHIEAMDELGQSGELELSVVVVVEHATADDDQCDQAEGCDTHECTGEATLELCAEACESNTDCSAGFICSSEGACVAEQDSNEAGGCQAAPDSRQPLEIILLFLGAALAAGYRRRTHSGDMSVD